MAQLQDQGIIIGYQPFGENDVILSVFSKIHGIRRGLVRGGTSKRKRSSIQAGNLIDLVWKARLEQQLGSFTFEVIEFFSAKFLSSSLMLEGFNILRQHLNYMPEWEPNGFCYELLLEYLNIELDKDKLVSYYYLAEIFYRFEMAYLQSFGAGLKLDLCAATGTRENLCYVSPKSGQAVCEEAGRPWKHRLLTLPKFITTESQILNSKQDLIDLHRMTSFFLEKNIWHPYNFKPVVSRNRFFANLIAEIDSFL